MGSLRVGHDCSDLAAAQKSESQEFSGRHLKLSQVRQTDSLRCCHRIGPSPKGKSISRRSRAFSPRSPRYSHRRGLASSSEPGFQRGKQACAKGEDLHPSRQRECSRCTAPRSFLSSPHTLRRRGAPRPQEGRRRRRTVVGGGKRESRDSEGTSEGASGQATRCPRLPAAPAGSRSPRAALRPTGRRRRRRTASAMLYNSQG